MNLTDESEKEHWQKELNIYFGMSKQQALENFRAWRENKKTCQRCEGEQYAEYCPIHEICEEGDKDERPITGNVDRSRNVEAVKYKGFRIDEFEARKRTSIR